ncbi:MAG: low-specificity L-threonine aldolase [Verrucomicrobia bacterium]|nr:low-specificity L-threonine aldolase [Verrucomicrobiota bacterium]
MSETQRKLPPIDLRSDTVTQPTPAMREAMARAAVGDDVFGEDPTVNELEARTAALLGKEAALFLPSGTMSNQVAIRAHTEHGDEILLEVSSHAYLYEAGAPAALSGVMCRLIPGKRGLFTAEDLRAAVRPTNMHFPPARLLCVENTHNQGGGSVWPLEQIAEVAEAARELGLRTHLDGARLWNAAAAAGRSEAEYAAYFDSVNVCFSKGLGAPVGSAQAGSAEFIRRARRFRKQFGGGMRQAGILAAAALYALERHRSRLAEDHANAKRLAQGLANLPGLDTNPAEVETNIVLIRTRSMPAPEMVRRLQQQGVLTLARDAETIRAVTHLQVSAEDIDRALNIWAEVVA